MFPMELPNLRGMGNTQGNPSTLGDMSPWNTGKIKSSITILGQQYYTSYNHSNEDKLQYPNSFKAGTTSPLSLSETRTLHCIQNLS